MGTSPQMAVFGPGGELDSTAGPRTGVMLPPDSMMAAAVMCAEQFAQTDMVPIGFQLWGSFALIIVIWTGVTMMLSGGINMGEIISLVLLLGLPWAILTWYSNPVGTPWGDQTFVRMITAGAQAIAWDLLAGSWENFSRRITSSLRSIWTGQMLGELKQKEAQAGAADANAPAEDDDDGWWSGITSGISDAIDVITDFIPNLIRSWILACMTAVLVLLTIIPAVVIYCSYLWSFLIIVAATIIGPLLVPFALIPQLSFLFWGWFKTLVGGAVHMIVAAAAFVVVQQFMTLPLDRLVHAFGVQAASANWDVADLFMTGIDVLFESGPIIVLAYLGAFKINEIANMIVSGGSMPASGMMDRVRGGQSIAGMGRSAGRLVRGGSGASKVLAIGGPKGKAAAAVLSVATK